MTETHPHEWLFDIYEKNEKTVCRFVCRHDFCDEVLEGPEVLKRLNATERLSRGDAFYAGAQLDEAPDDDSQSQYNYKNGVRLALLAYAGTLEGDA